jgi:uncharacterized circularly permuted ATP-grasp superfamily protein
VIYRRIDDAFLDPEVFRPTACSACAAHARVGAGKVALANALGQRRRRRQGGVRVRARDHPLLPGEEPILEQVPTYVCARDDDRSYVLEHLGELVVKAVDEAGGYGMLMGPTSTRPSATSSAAASRRSRASTSRSRASSCRRARRGTPSPSGSSPRRVDLRPYVLTGPSGPWVLPGGLTRVALREGSYVVNSSQGGGSKDTWVQKPP